MSGSKIRHAVIFGLISVSVCLSALNLFNLTKLPPWWSLVVLGPIIVLIIVDWISIVKKVKRSVFYLPVRGRAVEDGEYYILPSDDEEVLRIHCTRELWEKAIPRADKWVKFKHSDSIFKIASLLEGGEAIEVLDYETAAAIMMDDTLNELLGVGTSSWYLPVTGVKTLDDGYVQLVASDVQSLLGASESQNFEDGFVLLCKTKQNEAIEVEKWVKCRHRKFYEPRMIDGVVTQVIDLDELPVYERGMWSFLCNPSGVEENENGND